MGGGCSGLQPSFSTDVKTAGIYDALGIGPETMQLLNLAELPPITPNS
jgi:hypothetical protein